MGTNADSLRNNEQLSERYELVFEEKFNDVYEPGVVCDQQPVEGTKMPNRGRVTIYVSKGPELIEMPAVVGMPIEDAIMALTDLELNYQVIEVYDKSYEPDVIERAEPEPGAQLNKEKDTVFLYIRKVVMEESSSSEDERDDPGTVRLAGHHLPQEQHGFGFLPAPQAEGGVGKAFWE